MRVLAVALLAAALAYGLRAAHVLALAPDGPGGRLESFDPDSQYHARRVARALSDGGAVAGRDPLLAWPEWRERGGAPIPWPPYYDAALAGVARLRGGADPRGVAADTVARAPAWLAALTAALAAVAAAGLAARGRQALLAAAVAGAGVALSFAHLRYSFLGMGDHHAAVTALMVLLYLMVGRGVRPAAVRGPRLSAVRGALAGLVAGALVGTWVAGIALVVPVQAALLWIVLRPGAPAPVGLVLFATSFHKALVLALLPAVLTSPWPELRPLDVVDLSWFHVAWFGISWLAFAPIVFLPRSRARRAPALLAAALLALLLVLARGGASEALEWATAGNRFMASINESQPLIGAGAGLGAVTKWLGWGVLLLPVAWASGAWRALREREDGLLVWLIAAAPLALAASGQRRFAEALAPVLAVLLGVLAARLIARHRRVAAAAVALVALAHVGTLQATAQRARGGALFTPQRTDATARHAALADLLDELRAAPRAGAVLAQWDHGHAIEWWGEAPTVATNFGLYLGAEAFLAPWRFLLATDEAAGERVLLARDASYVLVTRDGRRNLAAAGAALAGEVPAPDDEAAWRATLLARLLAADRADAAAHPPYLRLVAARSADGPGGRVPWARLFERVEGARVVVRGEPGARVSLRMRVPAGDGGLYWWHEEVVNPAGEARLRVPYPTGGGRGAATQVDLRVGPVTVPLDVSEAAVLAGDTVEVVAPPRAPDR